MRARCPQARFAMLSTAWSRTDPFWTIWANDDPSWLRLKATAGHRLIFPDIFVEQEHRALGENGFKRGIPVFPGVERQVHSAGIFMSERHEFMCRWCRMDRTFNRALRKRQGPWPTRSAACFCWRLDDLHSGDPKYLALFQASDHRPRCRA